MGDDGGATEGEVDDALLINVNNITQGAGLFLAGNVFSQGVDLIKTVLLAQFLGASLYGVFAYVGVVFSVVRVFTRLGGDSAVLRFVPEFKGDSDKQRRFVTLAYGTGFLSSVIGAIVLYQAAPVISRYTLANPLFVDVLRIAAIVLPFTTASQVSYSVFKSIDLMEYNVGVSLVVRPLLQLVFVGGGVLLGYSLYGAIAGLVVAGVLTFLATVVMVVKTSDLGHPSVPSLAEARRYYDYSVPLTLNQIGGFLYNRVDLLMVGVFLSEQVVGIYKISVVISGFLLLPLTGFNQLFPPIASELYHDGKVDQLEGVYSNITRLIFVTTVFPAMVILVFPEEILRIFGSEFSRGSIVVTLFVVAQLTNSIVGPSGYVLMMTDHQYLTSFNTVTSGLLNIVLNYVMILEFGFVGAAVATASVLSLVNVARVVEVWYLEGITPYSQAFLNPVLSGVASGVAMYALSLFVTSRYLLVVGMALGGVVYATSLFAIGLEDEDVALIDNVLKQFGVELPSVLR